MRRSLYNCKVRDFAVIFPENEEKKSVNFDLQPIDGKTIYDVSIPVKKFEQLIEAYENYKKLHAID